MLLMSAYRSPYYSQLLLENFANPVGAGGLSAPDVTGEAGSRRCGDLVRIDLQVSNGVVTDAGFRAYGCPAAIAGASEVVRRIRGRTVLDAARVGWAALLADLELAPERRSCVEAGVDALHKALQCLISRDVPLTPQGGARDPRGVVVGMSGGVDSAVAAVRLLEDGLHPIGVTFRLWSDPSCGLDNACCSPEAVRDARDLAHQLGLAHFVVDLSHKFYAEVVEYFVAEYAQARTPNPCARCNAAVRFGELLELADRLGAEWGATGHYARMLQPEGSLARGQDPDKDQSYVLALVDPGLLRRMLFPLGELTKAAVRELARERGLTVHDRPESQEICFVPDDDYRRFLRERLPEAPGAIVDREGRRLGSHEGLYGFTIGQRRGLGISASQPQYVVELRPEQQTVVVGPGEAADVHRVVVGEVVPHRKSLPAEAEVQLRSSGGSTRAEVETGPEDRLILRLSQPVRGVAPGQVAVLYSQNRVVAAGTIIRTD